jgi:hypothetical protein
MILLLVIPAKAGIQFLALASVSAPTLPEKERRWIPAFAGMTGLEA